MGNRSLYFIDMLVDKINKDGKICEKDYGTWDTFREMSRTHKIVCFGTGIVFSYFMEQYGEEYAVGYVIDKVKCLHEKQCSGIPVYNTDILKNDKQPKIILVTMINYSIDKTISIVNRMGIAAENVFVLPQMEYWRKDIQDKLIRYKEDECFRELCSMSYDNVIMNSKLERLTKRLGVFYYTTYHTNRMLNAVIDRLDDNEDMIREQISEKFVRVMKNEYTPDFDNPKTLNEKILTMAINEADNPLWAEVTDKYTFKAYVSNIVGDKYVVPLIGVWDSVSDIDFNALPDRFVIKSTNGGNSSKVILVPDKSKLDIVKLCKMMSRWLNPYNSVYYENFNGSFKHVKNRIIAEEMLNISETEIYDYKIHCFNGVPKLIHVVKQHPHQVSIFDTAWMPCDFSFGYPYIDEEVERPKEMDEMLEIAEKLSKPFKYVRVDFYLVNGEIYVGELTLTHMAGMGKVTPVSWDRMLGNMID